MAGLRVLFARLATILIFGYLVSIACGCGKHEPAPDRAVQASILDVQMAGADKEIKEAERTLDTDYWQTNSIKNQVINRSKTQREDELAAAILQRIKTQSRSVDAFTLVRSIKTYNLRKENPAKPINGLAYSVYLQGNQILISELKNRPADDLRAVLPLLNNSEEIFTGDSGPPFSLSDLRDQLLDKIKSGKN